MLVDTTVWVDHLRRGDEILVGQLEQSQVSVHPFVIGELACGNLRNRGAILTAITQLPRAPVVAHEAALEFLESRGLAGCGLGWVDVHLLASAVASGDKLLTRDRKMREVAEALSLA